MRWLLVANYLIQAKQNMPLQLEICCNYADTLLKIPDAKDSQRENIKLEASDLPRDPELLGKSRNAY